MSRRRFSLSRLWLYFRRPVPNLAELHVCRTLRHLLMRCTRCCRTWQRCQSSRKRQRDGHQTEAQSNMKRVLPRDKALCTLQMAVLAVIYLERLLKRLLGCSHPPLTGVRFHVYSQQVVHFFLVHPPSGPCAWSLSAA